MLVATPPSVAAVLLLLTGCSGSRSREQAPLRLAHGVTKQAERMHVLWIVLDVAALAVGVSSGG